jgi:ribosome-binding protein aMBF1 (putative translation factor)
MTPDEIRLIRSTFDLDPRGLARALAMSTSSVLRWEAGTSAPTGLHEEILRALHGVALRVRDHDARRREIAGRISLGIGALIHDLLTCGMGRRGAAE